MQINASNNLYTTDEKKGIKKDPEVGINGKNYKISDSGKEGTVSQKFADSLNKLSESNGSNKEPNLSFISVALNKTEKAIASDLMKNKFSEFDPDGSGESSVRGVSTAPKDPIKKSSGFDPSGLKFGNADNKKFSPELSQEIKQNSKNRLDQRIAESNLTPVQNSSAIEKKKQSLKDATAPDSNLKLNSMNGENTLKDNKTKISSFDPFEVKFSSDTKKSSFELLQGIKDISNNPNANSIKKSNYEGDRANIELKSETSSSKFNAVDDKLKKFLDKLSSSPELLEKAKQSENQKIQDFIKNNNL